MLYRNHRGSNHVLYIKVCFRIKLRCALTRFWWSNFTPLTPVNFIEIQDMHCMHLADSIYLMMCSCEVTNERCTKNLGVLRIMLVDFKKSD